MKTDHIKRRLDTMRLFSWGMLAVGFLVAAVQAQSVPSVADDAVTASGVNVANVPDCAVSTPKS